MNILTFDIEEWFHILDNDSTKGEGEWRNYEYRLDANLDRLLSFLKDNDQKATFFVLGWVAEQFPRAVREIHAAGFEIGSHSHMHQLAYTQSPAEFRADLDRSIKVLEDVTGSPVEIYRAPGFSLTEDNAWVFDALVSAGIRIDCSVFPARRAHGGFERYGYANPSLVEYKGCRIKEFPLNLGTLLGRRFVYSGGGYFRVMPYWLIKRLMRQDDYVMTYFHPRDFDAGQPLIKELSLVRKFKSYYGLSGAFAKLRNLIRDFEFVDLATADQQTDWDSAKVVSV